MERNQFYSNFIRVLRPNRFIESRNKEMKINLDLDGVMADFEKSATKLYGMSPHEYEKIHGSTAFWKGIFSVSNFFRNLDPMPDALELWNHVNASSDHSLQVITGVPRMSNGQVEIEKREWVKEHLGEVPVVCCLSREKSDHCNPGDILIDDRTDYKHLWEAKGGVYIVHTSAKESIRQLKTMGL